MTAAWANQPDHTTDPAVRTDWEWDNPVFRTLDPEHYADLHNQGIGISRDWADHRDKWNTGGNITYSCHPYSLHGDALDDFATLRKAGWRVHITGSTYNPGSTVRVDITAPAYLWRGGPRRGDQ